MRNISSSPRISSDLLVGSSNQPQQLFSRERTGCRRETAAHSVHGHPSACQPWTSAHRGRLGSGAGSSPGERLPRRHRPPASIGFRAPLRRQCPAEPPNRVLSPAGGVPVTDESECGCRCGCLSQVRIRMQAPYWTLLTCVWI